MPETSSISMWSAGWLCLWCFWLPYVLGPLLAAGFVLMNEFEPELTSRRATLAQ